MVIISLLDILMTSVPFTWMNSDRTFAWVFSNSSTSIRNNSLAFLSSPSSSSSAASCLRRSRLLRCFASIFVQSSWFFARASLNNDPTVLLFSPTNFFCKWSQISRFLYSSYFPGHLCENRSNNIHPSVSLHEFFRQKPTSTQSL